MSKATARRLHRCRHPHPDRQGAARHVPQRPPRRPAGRGDPLGHDPGAGPRSETDRGRHHRLLLPRGRVRPQHGAQRRAAGRPAQYRGRRHRQSLLRLGHHRRGDGRRPHPRRPGRRDDRRRRRVDVHGADGRLPSIDQHECLCRRERRHGLRHGPHRREGRQPVEGHARDAGPVRAGIAPAGHCRPAGGRVQRRDDRGRDRRARAKPCLRCNRPEEAQRQSRRRRAGRFQLWPRWPS
jgi:hypothetical protein